MKIGIIGSGLAGLSAADHLVSAGHDVMLADKARGPGGRMSTRRTETAQGLAFFDHGAQYFTVRDPGFAAQVARWEQQGHAARWPAAAPDAWVGTPGMNAIIKAMAAAHQPRWNCRITRIARNGSGWVMVHDDGTEQVDTVLVAVPAEQAADLLSDIAPDWAQLAATTPSQPCWTVMAAFDAPVSFAGDCLRATGAIGWAARNRAKPGRTGPETWVVQGSAQWSAEHLEADGETIIAQLLAGLAAATGATLPAPLTLQAHRWRYALSGAAARTSLWDGALGLGVCGDWLIGPRIENAWLSGRALANLVAPV